MSHQSHVCSSTTGALFLVQLLQALDFVLAAGASIIVSNGTSMTNNTAVTRGGAVSCAGCQSVTMLSNVFMTANMARQAGGASYFEECTDVQMDQADFANNR